MQNMTSRELIKLLHLSPTWISLGNYINLSKFRPGGRLMQCDRFTPLQQSLCSRHGVLKHKVYWNIVSAFQCLLCHNLQVHNTTGCEQHEGQSEHTCMSGTCCIVGMQADRANASLCLHNTHNTCPLLFGTSSFTNLPMCYLTRFATIQDSLALHAWIVCSFSTSPRLQLASSIKTHTHPSILQARLLAMH